VGNVTVWVAGLPCQGFSPMGDKEGTGHVESGLLDQVTRLLAEQSPRNRPAVLWLECVPQLLNDEDGDTWDSLICSLAALGYATAWRVCDARAWVAQHRERLFVLCTRTGFDPAAVMLGESVPAAEALAALQARGGADVRVFAPNQARGMPMASAVPTILTGGSSLIVMGAGGELSAITRSGQAALQGMTPALADWLCAEKSQKLPRCAIGNACVAYPLRYFARRLVQLATAQAAGAPPPELPPLHLLERVKGVAPGPRAHARGGVCYPPPGGRRGAPAVYAATSGRPRADQGAATMYPCAAAQPLLDFLRAVPGAALVPAEGKPYARKFHGFLHRLHSARDECATYGVQHADVLRASLQVVADSVCETLPAAGETWRVSMQGASPPTLVTVLSGASADSALHSVRVRPVPPPVPRSAGR